MALSPRNPIVETTSRSGPGYRREVVCCDERALARFDVLRRRRNEAVVFLYAFDLLELDGVDLRREPLEVRNPTLAIRLRRALEDALREVQEVQSSANVQNDL